MIIKKKGKLSDRFKILYDFKYEKYVIFRKNNQC